MPAFEVDLPARASEVARVRRGLRAVLVRYGLDTEHADVAQLVASELAMNAVLHGAEPIHVRVAVEPDATVIEVTDAGGAGPELDAGIGAPSRRGLHVVSALVADWGVIPHPEGGKTVWCTIGHGAHAPVIEDESNPQRRSSDEPSEPRP